uniref:DUF5741 domain-containing protein n=1 Tax=Mesocestoides corti TaxID=53468 RepID=A0A5K3G0R7_MESCO
LAEEQCRRLSAREQKLADELEAKQVQILSLERDLKAARLTAAETQAVVENLRSLVAIEREEKERLSAMKSTLELEDNAREYSELKAVALELKSRLLKRAELLENSLREARRLRGIVCDNKESAEGFGGELERQYPHTENNSRSGDDDAAPSCTQALGAKLCAAPAAASLPPSSIFSQRDRRSCIPNQPTFVTFPTHFGQLSP